MKIVIAVPPIEDFYFTGHRFACHGADIVSAVCKAAGFETVIRILPLEKKPAVKSLPLWLEHLKPFIMTDEKSGISFFTSFKRYGAETAEAADSLIAEKPDAVFFSLFAWCYSAPLLELASCIKSRAPGIKLAAGGSGISCAPDYFKTAGLFDFIVQGEAEFRLNDILEELSGKKIPPEADFRPSVKITAAGKGSVSISASLSRGCPKHCSFCSNHLTFGRKFRTPRLSAVEEAVRKLPDAEKAFVNIEDDNIMLDRDFFLSVIDIFRHKYSWVLFSAENGIDYTEGGADFIQTLIDRGFYKFNISLGTTDTASALRQKRAFRPELYSALMEVLEKNSIPSISYHICGLEGDSPDKTARFLSELFSYPTQSGLSLFYPVPGINSYTDMDIFKGLNPGLAAGSSAWPWNKGLNTSELVTAFRLSRLFNLLKKTSISPPEKELLQKIFKENRIFTYAENLNKLCAVPGLSTGMTEKFLSGLVIDKDRLLK
jgi:hypothetical protein